MSICALPLACYLQPWAMHWTDCARMLWFVRHWVIPSTKVLSMLKILSGLNIASKCIVGNLITIFLSFDSWMYRGVRAHLAYVQTKNIARREHDNERGRDSLADQPVPPRARNCQLQREIPFLLYG